MPVKTLNIFSTFFLLSLLFSYGIIPTEERLLQVERIQVGDSTAASGKNSQHATEVENIDSLEFANFRRDVLKREGFDHAPPSNNRFFGNVKTQSDDYRPTTPGHSPGAGHSNGHSSDRPN